jgi:hypothetical protein
MATPTKASKLTKEHHKPRQTRSVWWERRKNPSDRCCLKDHFLGCLREIVGYCDSLADNSPDRFITARPTTIVEQCKKYDKGPYSTRQSKRAFKLAKELGIVTPGTCELRGVLRKGFFVADHEDICRRTGSYCVLQDKSGLYVTDAVGFKGSDFTTDVTNLGLHLIHRQELTGSDVTNGHAADDVTTDVTAEVISDVTENRADVTSGVTSAVTTDVTSTDKKSSVTADDKWVTAQEELRALLAVKAEKAVSEPGGPSEPSEPRKKEHSDPFPKPALSFSHSAMPDGSTKQVPVKRVAAKTEPVQTTAKVTSKLRDICIGEIGWQTFRGDEPDVDSLVKQFGAEKVVAACEMWLKDGTPGLRPGHQCQSFVGVAYRYLNPEVQGLGSNSVPNAETRQVSSLTSEYFIWINSEFAGINLSGEDRKQLSSVISQIESELSQATKSSDGCLRIVAKSSDSCLKLTREATKSLIGSGFNFPNSFDRRDARDVLVHNLFDTTMGLVLKEKESFQYLVKEMYKVSLKHFPKGKLIEFVGMGVMTEDEEAVVVEEHFRLQAQAEGQKGAEESKAKLAAIEQQKKEAQDRGQDNGKSAEIQAAAGSPEPPGSISVELSADAMRFDAAIIRGCGKSIFTTAHYGALNSLIEEHTYIGMANAFKLFWRERSADDNRSIRLAGEDFIAAVPGLIDKTDKTQEKSAETEAARAVSAAREVVA